MLLSNSPKPATASWSGPLMGAAFLMATSAIGPGFITQTTVFTAQLLTSFGFAIVVSILLDIIVQLNIWRVIAVSCTHAQNLANNLLPGLGHLLSLLVVLGGLAFNIGNIAGAGLGVNVLAGIDIRVGALISAVIAVLVFWFKDAGKAMDMFAKLLGFVMIALTLYVAGSSGPPLQLALKHSFLPEKIDSTAILTLVGGTVGGYISFAGIHRLLDADIKGVGALQRVSRSSITAIVIAGVMRILLFLAALGVVMGGGVLSSDNPAASVFSIAAGKAGYLIFGIVLWSAAITSVVGSAYTSVSFVTHLHPLLKKQERWVIITFIAICTAVFFIVGRPVKTLVFVGTLNGFILPVSLTIILIAAVKKRIVGEYKHPLWMTITGWLVVGLMSFISLKALLRYLV
jgi:Mn2+/Fe2+ NRAMP family transporter